MMEDDAPPIGQFSAFFFFNFFFQLVQLFTVDIRIDRLSHQQQQQQQQQQHIRLNLETEAKLVSGV